MNKIRNKLTLLLILTLALAFVFGLTGCGGDSVESIYVSNSNAPRLNYVEGQDLDLTGGVLTAVVNGAETQIPLTSEEVSVTGYDKNTIGQQTLTVSYKEQTTTIKVNVIARITADGYETGYFVNDVFKSDKGKLRVANDNATTMTVDMNDPRVSLVSFDSSTPGEKTVTVKYTSQGNTYTCSFKVNVYAASDVTIVYPKKTNYFSHDTGLDFTGGYLKVTAANNSSLMKYVDITDSMVTGFDLSAVTPANRDNPVKQTLTVTYLGKTFTYDITITYSGVSVIGELMDVINTIDPTLETVTLTKEQKEATYTAALEFMNLSETNKAFVSEADRDQILRCAAFAVKELYDEEMEKYSNTILIVDDKIQLLSKDYATTASDVAKLSDPDEQINVYAKILRFIKSSYPDLILKDEIKVADKIAIMTSQVQDNILLMLKHILEVYDILKVVPEGWTVETLSQYSEDILRATQRISRENYYENGYSSIYSILSAWRPANDFFDIIYSYFMFADEDLGGAEYVKSDLLSNIPWPKTLRDWYSSYYNAVYMSQSLYRQGTKLYMTDITTFMYHYEKLLEKSDAILKNTEDKLTYELFNLIEGTRYADIARTYFCGYYFHTGILHENEKFTGLWNDYLDLFELYATGELKGADNKISFEGHEELLAKITAGLTDLSATELYGFICSLNFLYNQSRGSVLALSKYENGYLNALALMLNTYYEAELGESGYPLFTNLMTAIENYALIGVKETAIDDFKAAMKTLNEEYEKIKTTTAGAAFKNLLGDMYDKYNAFYEDTTWDNEYTLNTETEELFTKLEEILNQIVTLNKYIASLQQSTGGNTGSGSTEDDSDGDVDVDTDGSIDTENGGGNESLPQEKMKEGTYILLFALYEEARAYYNEIVTRSADDAKILEALQNKKYTIGEVDLALDKAYFSAGNIFWSYITRLSLNITTSDGKTTTYSAYDIYSGTKNLRNYLAVAAELLYAEYYHDYSALDSDYVYAAANVFHSMERADVSTFRAFGGTTLHFGALKAFYSKTYESDAKLAALAAKLVEVDEAYLEYVFDTENAQKLEAFKSATVSMKALAEETKDNENYSKYFKNFVDQYTKLYDDLTASAAE